MVFVRRLPVVLCIFFLAIFSPVQSNGFSDGEDKEKLLPSGNYTVVGAFSFFNNALRFTEFTISKGYDAKWGYAPVKGLYYVYTLKTEDIEEAWRESYKLRKLPEFHDAWAMAYEYTPPPKVDEKPEQMPVADNNSADAGDSQLSESEPEGIAQTEDPEPEIPAEPEEKSYTVYLNTTSIKTLKEVNTDIAVMGAKNRKEIASLASHEFHTLTEEEIGDQLVKLECTPFGYRRIDKFIDFEDPINDSTRSTVHYQGDTVIIDFELNRYKPGDYIIMYNVYFYKDAALMKPISKPELNELLEMLQENDKLTVKIHGHTNGNARGKIIEMSDADTDYFTLRPTNITGKGSAKKLSLVRAEIIRRFLVENGIAEERMEVKGWGGKRPIVDKFHGDAHSNVRVEIEILSDS